MNRCITRAAASGLLALSLLVVASSAHGQGSDAALRDRVNQLVQRLDADKSEAREAAEKALIELGPVALPLLPDSSRAKSGEQKDRLERVRKALAEAQEQANLGPSIVTIQAKGIRLTEALKELQQQSGNVLTDLREQFGAEATNPGLDLDIDHKPFFEALDLICKQAEITPTFYTGDGTIGLMAGAADLPYMIGVSAPGELARKVIYTGPFRVEFRQIAANRDFINGTANANAQFEIAWEPRLRPMLLAMKAEDLKIEDDRGNAVQPTVQEESGSVVLRPENPAAELNLNMAAPDREAQTLAALRVKAEVSLPAGVRTFRFPDVTKAGKRQQDDIIVELDSFAVEEHVWKVRVMLAYPGEGPVFESYRQGLFNNEFWLQKPDGSRLGQTSQNFGGFSNTMYDAGKIGFEYLYVDVPGKPSDYGFVYETPSKVVTIPVEFEFQDVPLP